MILGSLRRQRAISKGSKFLADQILSGNYGLACHGQFGNTKFSDQKGHLFSIFFILEAMKQELPEIIRTIFLTRILSEETNGNWGYSPRAYYVETKANPYFVDADDTAFALRSLREMGLYRTPDPFDSYRVETSVSGETAYLYRTFLSDEKPSITSSPSALNNLMVHPEVNANVFQFLRGTEQEHPSAEQFASDVQQGDGLWSSYFYPLQFYGTWMFLSMLNTYEVGQHLMQSTVRGVLNYQNSSGSFGKGQDPLSTALALRCLQLAGYSGHAVDTGVKYLIKTQSRSGSWISREEIWKFHHEDGDVWTATDSNNVICTSMCVSVLKNYQST